MNNGRVKTGEEIRNFELKDSNENLISLSDFKGEKNIYLIFNRGFT
jgi:peroxiredoxin